MTTKPRTKAAAKPMPHTDPAMPVTVLTVAAGTIGPYGYTSGLLIEGVPPEMIAGNSSWLDADPQKVAEARAAGADSVPYRG